MLADIQQGKVRNPRRGSFDHSLGVVIYAVKPDADIASGSDGTCKIQKLNGGTFEEVTGLPSITCRCISGTATGGTVYIAARDPYGSWYIAAGDGGSGSGSGSGGSCCCPDDAYKLALPSDWETDFPNGITTGKRTAWIEHEATHVFNFGTFYPLYFKHLSEVTETIIEDGSILHFTNYLTVDRPDPGSDAYYFLNFWWDDTSGSVEALSLPHGYAAKSAPYGGPGAVAYGPSSGDAYYKYTDAGFDTTGTNTMQFDIVLRVNDVSLLGGDGRFLSYGYTPALDINRLYFPCVDGEPDTGEEPGSGGTPPL